MAIVIVEFVVKDEWIVAVVVAVDVVVLPNRVEGLAFYVVELVPLVPFGESSVETKDHRCSLMMVARNRDDD